MKRRTFLLSSSILGTSLFIPTFFKTEIGSPVDLLTASFKLQPPISYLSKFSSFNKMAIYFGSRNIDFEVSSLTNKPESHSFLLSQINNSYGRFGNFETFSPSDSGFFVVTRGPDGKNLRLNTGLQVISRLSDSVRTKCHFTDALPHYLNSKWPAASKGYKSYWIDSVSRSPLKIFLSVDSSTKISRNLISNINYFSVEIQKEFALLETLALKKIESQFTIFNFNSLVKNISNT